MQITITITEAQEAALFMMGKDEYAQQSIAQSTFASRVRGDFKQYRKAENRVNTEIYDDSSRRGAKWPVTKDEYLKTQMKDSLALLEQL